MNLYLWILILYSTCLILLSFFLSRFVKRPSDFYVASRGLGTGLLFSTLLAANIGAGSTVGATGLGYQNGFSAWWWVGSAGIGSILLAFSVGPRLWRIAALHRFYTVGDYLEFRYDRRVRGVIAALLWFGALAILAGQLIAVAWILSVVAQIPKWFGCLLGGMVVTTYFTLGGLLSTAWVNLAQVVVKIAGFALAVPWALASVGGWNQVRQQIISNMPSTQPLSAYLSFTGDNISGVLGYLVLLAPSFIISPGILQKIYGARNQSVVRRGVFLNAVGLLLFAFLPPILGITAHSVYPRLENPELALPMVMMNLLPPWLGGLALAAVFSAEISSADAILSMLSTSFAKDLMKGFLYPDLTEDRLLQVTRITSVVAGTLAVILAILIPSVISALQIFYALLTAALFVPLVFGLYWKRPTTSGALAAIGAGIPATLAIQKLTSGRGIGILSPVACGILMAASSMVVTTILGKNRSHNE